MAADGQGSARQAVRRACNPKDLPRDTAARLLTQSLPCTPQTPALAAAAAQAAAPTAATAPAALPASPSKVRLGKGAARCGASRPAVRGPEGQAACKQEPHTQPPCNPACSFPLQPAAIATATSKPTTQPAPTAVPAATPKPAATAAVPAAAPKPATLATASTLASAAPTAPLAAAAAHQAPLSLAAPTQAASPTPATAQHQCGASPAAASPCPA